MVFKCSTFTTIDVRFDQSKKNAGKGCAKKIAVLNHKSATFVCASQNFVLVVMVVGWGYIFLPSWMRHNADTGKHGCFGGKWARFGAVFGCYGFMGVTDGPQILRLGV